MGKSIYGKLYDENGRRLAKLSEGLSHIWEEFNPNKIFRQPKLPNLNFPYNLEEIAEWRIEVLEKRNAKNQEAEEPTKYGNITNPLRESAIAGDFKGIAVYSKMYAVNARGYGEDEETILMEAIRSSADRKSKVQSVKLLLKCGAFINTPDNEGRTALHHSTFIDDAEIVGLILKAGANWYIRDNVGLTPIHTAAGCSSTDVLLAVLKKAKGHDEVNHGDSDDMTPLHWAVSNNKIENLKLMLQKKFKIKSIVQDIEGKSPLHWCAQHLIEFGKIHIESCASLLISHDPSIINIKDFDGRTSLHLACGENNVGLINLIARNPICEINCQDDLKRTPLHWAAVAGYSSIIYVLLKFGADDSISDEIGAIPLHYAASKNHIQCVYALTEGRKYAYTPDNEGRMPIVWATMKGHLQTVKTLLERGVDIEYRDIQGCTALHSAAETGNTMCASLLIKHGCNVDSADNMNRTPLFKAIEKGLAETAAILIQKGANSSFKDIDQRVPLHLGAMFGHLNVLSLLLASGADPNSKDSSGKTPLDCAAFNGNCEVISFLVKNKADPNSRDLDGITALHWACGSGQAEATERLLSLGANANMIDFTTENDLHSTPLDYAISTNSYECIEILNLVGALKGEELMDIAVTVISRIWKGYQVRKKMNVNIRWKKNAIVPVPQPQFKITGSGGSQVFNYSQMFNSEPLLFDDDQSNQYIEVIKPKKIFSQLDENDRNLAASIIQKAWRSRQTRIETKFLINIMGPEEAANMIRKKLSMSVTITSVSNVTDSPQVLKRNATKKVKRYEPADMVRRGSMFPEPITQFMAGGLIVQPNAAQMEMFGHSRANLTQNISTADLSRRKSVIHNTLEIDNAPVLLKRTTLSPNNCIDDRRPSFRKSPGMHFVQDPSKLEFTTNPETKSSDVSMQFDFNVTSFSNANSLSNINENDQKPIEVSNNPAKSLFLPGNNINVNRRMSVKTILLNPNVTRSNTKTNNLSNDNSKNRGSYMNMEGFSDFSPTNKLSIMKSNMKINLTNSQKNKSNMGLNMDDRSLNVLPSRNLQRSNTMLAAMDAKKSNMGLNMGEKSLNVLPSRNLQRSNTMLAAMDAKKSNMGLNMGEKSLNVLPSRNLQRSNTMLAAMDAKKSNMGLNMDDRSLNVLPSRNLQRSNTMLAAMDAKKSLNVLPSRNLQRSNTMLAAMDAKKSNMGLNMDDRSLNQSQNREIITAKTPVAEVNKLAVRGSLKSNSTFNKNQIRAAKSETRRVSIDEDAIKMDQEAKTNRQIIHDITEDEIEFFRNIAQEYRALDSSKLSESSLFKSFLGSSFSIFKVSEPTVAKPVNGKRKSITFRKMSITVNPITEDKLEDIDKS